MSMLTKTASAEARWQALQLTRNMFGLKFLWKTVELWLSAVSLRKMNAMMSPKFPFSAIFRSLDTFSRLGRAARARLNCWSSSLLRSSPIDQPPDNCLTNLYPVYDSDE